MGFTEGTLWVVTCGTAGIEGTEEDLRADAFCSCVGIFTDKDVALKNMTAYKDTFIKELVEELDEDDVVREEIESSLETYGSEKEEYYEVDYNVYGHPYECYIRIEEVDLY